MRGELSKVQARQLYVHAVKAVRDEDVVGCLQWCTCSHCDKPEPSENEYGIHRQDYSPKPAAIVFRDAMKVPLFA